MRTYSSEDDLEVFMTWIHSLMCFYDLHQIVGPEHNHNRTIILCAALTDRAQTWYNTTICTGTRGLHAFLPAFLTILLNLADTFVTPAAVTKAQHSFDKVTYTAWNEAYIMLVSCIDYALDMTCIQSVSQCFIVGGIL